MAQLDKGEDFYEAALRGYEQSKVEIEKKIAELRGLLRNSRHRPTAPGHPKAKRTLSASARKRIADAQKRRWAKARRQREVAS